MELNFATNTTLALLNRLGRSSADDAFSIESNTTEGTSDNYTSSQQSPDNYHTFIVKDTLATGGYIYSAVNMYAEELEKLGHYLVQLRDKELTLATQTAGSQEYDRTLYEKKHIETELSRFIGQNVHINDLELVSVQGGANTNDESFMDVVNIHADASDENSDIVGIVSSIEVELNDLFSASHDASNCPHCIAKAQSNIGGIDEPTDLASSSASGSTPDKQATSVSATSDPQVETIRKGYKWNIGANDQLTYSFFEGAVNSPAYPSTYRDGNTASGANGLEQGITATGPDNATALTQVMEAWDKTVDFNFLKVTEDPATGAVGDIRMAFTTDGAPFGRAAFAYYPSWSHVGGDVWFETHDIDKNFDAAGNDFNSTGLGDGGYSWYAALHEVGHALGLSHPFDGGSATGATLPSNEDNMRTSVMSYTQLDRNLVFNYTASGGGFSTGNSYKVFATTPMLADVKAMALIYGSETTSDGDTNYSFAVDSDRNQSLMMQTIIDTGGIDTIDLSNQTRSSTLNMNGGSLSSIGVWSEADQISHWASQTGLSLSQVTTSFNSYNTQATASGKSTGAIYTGEDNLAIAFNASIENAIGGSSADTITGNSLDNMITGGGGNDIIDGGDGNDVAVYSGDRYNYTITDNGDGTTTVSGADGNDTVSNIESLQFVAGASSARGASAITSLTQTADLTGTSTFDIAVDGEASITVTFNGSDYTSGGLTMTDLMSDLETAINSALSSAGQSTSVTVSQNSPLQVTSNHTGDGTAVSINSLSGPLQAALGAIQLDQRIQVGDNVYYGMGSGAVTIAPPAGNFSPSNPTPNTPSTPATPSIPTSPGATPGGPGTPDTPETSPTPEVIPSNGPGLPSHIGGISLRTQEDAAKAVIVLDRAIQQITSSQAKLGAIQNRLDYNISNLTKSAMLTETAKGRITDADFATETAILVKNQILAQAATQALNMANQSRQGVIGLLN